MQYHEKTLVKKFTLRQFHAVLSGDPPSRVVSLLSRWRPILSLMRLTRFILALALMVGLTSLTEAAEGARAPTAAAVSGPWQLTMDDFDDLPYWCQFEVMAWSQATGRSDIRGVELLDEGGCRLLITVLLPMQPGDATRREGLVQVEVPLPFPVHVLAHKNVGASGG